MNMPIGVAYLIIASLSIMLLVTIQKVRNLREEMERMIRRSGDCCIGDDASPSNTRLLDGLVAMGFPIDTHGGSPFSVAEEALEAVRLMRDQAKEAKDRLRHYQYDFVPACKAEADRWHDMWEDAVITYGNAQHRFENALEAAYKHINKPMPGDIVEMIGHLNKIAEKRGVDQVRVVTPDPKLAFVDEALHKPERLA